MKSEIKIIPKSQGKEIEAFIHCRKCLIEVKWMLISPADYQRISVGWTKDGLQVWCDRHNCNIVKIP